MTLFKRYHIDKAPLQSQLLAIIMDAQRYGNCPWCDCPIGATLEHWVDGCPFKSIAILIADAKMKDEAMR